MFGISLTRTSKLMAIYDKIAIFAMKITRLNNLQMEIKGKVIQNLGIQSGTSKAGKAWSKASILIETEGQYPKKVVLDNLKNADEFGKLTVGSTGTFHIEIESREYNGRWYSSVNCWKWATDGPVQSPVETTPEFPLPPLPGGHDTPFPDQADDLPF